MIGMWGLLPVSTARPAMSVNSYCRVYSQLMSIQSVVSTRRSSACNWRLGSTSNPESSWRNLKSSIQLTDRIQRSLRCNWALE